MKETLFNEFKDSLVRKSPNEFEATDPQTGGTWMVRANVPIGEFMALHTIGTKRTGEDVAPAKGVTITINLNIEIGGD